MRHIDFETLPIGGPLAELLGAVSRRIAQLPVRLRGTFCGSLAHADPAAHWSLVAVALEAEIMACSAQRGVRVIPARAFFESVMATALTEDELITEVQIPLLAPRTRFGFEEVVVRAGSFPAAMALACARPDGAAFCNVRIAIGGLEAVPRRLHAAEAVVEGRVPSPALLAECAKIAADATRPIASDRSDSHYRRNLAHAVTLRALQRATSS